MRQPLPRFRPPRPEFLTPEEQGRYGIIDGVRVMMPPEGLGLAPLAIAAGASEAKKILQHSDPKRDRERDARIATAENLAMTGSIPAAAYVWQRTGHPGTRNVPAIPAINFPGGPVAKGASDDEQYHARTAWQRILKALPAVAAAAQAGNFNAALPTAALQPQSPPQVVPVVADVQQPSTIERIAQGLVTAAGTVRNVVDSVSAGAQPFTPPPSTQPLPPGTIPLQPQPPAPPAQGSMGTVLFGTAAVSAIIYAATRGSSRRRGRRRR